ncbi:unnamed protein product [Mytilus coruscus]|nr:unnamed protein product [Mytilus coruscus]
MHWIVAFGCYEFFQYAWRKMTTLEQKRILGRDYRSNLLVKSFFPLAVLGGSVDIVKELIGAGADVNCFSENWETPLYVAVKSGNSDMVRVLVEHKAKVNLRGWFSMNIPCTVTSNKHELTNLILEYDLNQTELHIAVRHNDLQKLRSTIRSGNIDFRTKSGWTVLHYAVLSNNVEAVKVLVDQREALCTKPTSKVSIVDNNGLTAVHLAVINDNIEILSLLLRNKAEVNVRDVFDRTPLHYIKSASATKLLLSHSFQNHCVKTNRNAEEERMYEKYGKTQMSAFSTICLNITLHTSFRNVGRDVVNMPDREGNTPLHSVLKNCLLKGQSSECIETLLDNGANRYLFNDSGTTAIELMESSCDTVQYMNNSEKYKLSIQKTYIVFVVAMIFLMNVTFGLSVHLDSVISEECHTAVLCVGQDAESKFRSANLSCTSLAYNVTYKNGVDFSVQCHTKDNFTMSFFNDSFNVTYGTLTIGASFIDWSEIGLQCLYCLNLSLHAICADCFLHCILVFVQKKLGQENNFMLLLNGIAMCLLYGYMLCHLMF